MDGSNTMTTNTRTRTYNDPETIETAVRRYLEKGESVATLAKYYKVSQPAVYKWIQQHKENRVEKLRTTENKAHLAPEQLAQSSRVDLQIIIDKLEREKRELRDRLLDMMIKHGEMP